MLENHPASLRFKKSIHKPQVDKNAHTIGARHAELLLPVEFTVLR
jgi:hypothetical protein